ncbi:uroporphyrinogen-III synthase [Sphingomonas gellani]|uniref:Uroporphyrinogen-III synthase n=1 Tax=Sphingomonas gellani TaxID=1166340 RepID=A0A1H8HGY9_9SPHN|nr:uroporphyrinogen-III synthase [Sphingomonas gellani]SEN55462.1 uroporphyrinogen-III synthase [Sphingomonas gellani]
MGTAPVAALVLRPEPGNSVTAKRLSEAGIVAHRLPLFLVRPLDWVVPDPARFDALLLTSANAVRHAGAGLLALAGLPAVAVGQATARQAEDAGLCVTVVGADDAATVVAQARAAGLSRLLHLGGRERVALADVEGIAVYASDEVAVAPSALERHAGAVAMLHSARAAARFAALVDAAEQLRQDWRLAALSMAVAQAAGEGWGEVRVAPAPTDRALIDLLARYPDASRSAGAD